MRSILSALPSMEGVEDLLQDHLVRSLMLICILSFNPYREWTKTDVKCLIARAGFGG